MLVDKIRRYLKNHGWKEAHNGPPRIGPGAQLDLVKIINDEVDIPSITKREGILTGREALQMLVRIRADLNREDILWLLNHQRKIPREWRQYILLTAYLCVDEFGCMRVARLFWNADHWAFDFNYCSSDCGPCCRAIRPINE